MVFAVVAAVAVAQELECFDGRAVDCTFWNARGCAGTPVANATIEPGSNETLTTNGLLRLCEDYDLVFRIAPGSDTCAGVGKNTYYYCANFQQCALNFIEPRFGLPSSYLSLRCVFSDATTTTTGSTSTTPVDDDDDDTRASSPAAKLRFVL